MPGLIPAVVDLAGSNLVLVVIVAVIALGALAWPRCSAKRSWMPTKAPTT